MKAKFGFIGAVAALGLAAMLVGQSNAAPTPTLTFTVSGRVIRNVDSQPVVGASVRAEGSGARAPRVKNTTTDAVGQFTITGLDRGTYSIRASKTGVGSGSSLVTLGQGVTKVGSSPLRMIVRLR
ncbi:MAG TPA: carboxypeptidase-like regulatory domain-containing protein [Phycisphaerales bacterium]|nr:carboxypeptidase-like regulatory domain-containing protein [Phycisphaerales bacterium]